MDRFPLPPDPFDDFDEAQFERILDLFPEAEDDLKLQDKLYQLIDTEVGIIFNRFKKAAVELCRGGRGTDGTLPAQIDSMTSRSVLEWSYHQITGDHLFEEYDSPHPEDF